MHEYEKLSFTLCEVNDILHEIKLRAPKYQKSITECFLLEKHIVTLKAFPPRYLRSTYTVPPSKYTTDILWAVFIVFILCCRYSLLSIKGKLSDCFHIKRLSIDF